MIAKNPLKQKKCKICRDKFRPRGSLQVVCGFICALKLVEISKKKKAKADLKSGRDKLKTRPDYLKDTQKAFNRFIRARDYFLPCISCGTTKNIQYAAGHYFTIGGHPELRFDEDNCHKQCNFHCNMQLSGNIAAFRVNLLKKIGSNSLEKLEGSHEAKNYSVECLIDMKTGFNKRAIVFEKYIATKNYHG